MYEARQHKEKVSRIMGNEISSLSHNRKHTIQGIFIKDRASMSFDDVLQLLSENSKNDELLLNKTYYLANSDEISINLDGVDLSKLPFLISYIFDKSHIKKTRIPLGCLTTVIITENPIKGNTYLHNDKYYKIMDDRNKAESMNNKWIEANKHIPVPKYGVQKVEIKSERKWAFYSVKVDGNFFKFSQIPTLNRLRDWINASQDIETLVKMNQYFTYVCNCIGDGQGIFNDNSGKIYFIDINLNGTTPAANMIVELLQKKISSLKG